MATQTLEFNATPGLTISCKAFALRADTVLATVTATEKTNDDGRYTVAFTDLAAGPIRLSGFVSGIAGFVNEIYDVLDATATYISRGEAAVSDATLAKQDTIITALGNVPNVAAIVAGFGGTVILSQPVATTGQITAPIVIGDDYLASNGRAFAWTIPAITGMTVAGSACKFGAWNRSKRSFIVAGTVSDAGSGNWLLSFDLTEADTALLEPGKYEWSVEVSQDGSQTTQVRNDGDCYEVALVRRST